MIRIVAHHRCEIKNAPGQDDPQDRAINKYAFFHDLRVTNENGPKVNERPGNDFILWCQMHNQHLSISVLWCDLQSFGLFNGLCPAFHIHFHEQVGRMRFDGTQ